MRDARAAYTASSPTLTSLGVTSTHLGQQVSWTNPSTYFHLAAVSQVLQQSSHLLVKFMDRVVNLLAEAG